MLEILRPLLALPLLAAAAPEEIKLWPAGPPHEPEDFSPKVEADDEELVRLVTEPTLTAFPASANEANGAAVIICPGGGYQVLAWPKEGTEIAEWFNSIGVSAYVLKYRVPRRPGKHWLPPASDALRAMRIVRHNAGEWGLDPRRIGILGFSAGGHLSLMTAIHHDAGLYEAVDEIDETSARPDFVMPIYAAYLTDEKGAPNFSPEVRFEEDTPPMFLAVSQDDKTRAADAARVFIRLSELGVPAEAHLYTHGGHGYGIRPGEDPVLTWHHRGGDWLQRMGFLGE